MADVQARYANENPCQKSGCRNKARWTYGGGIFCGVHMKHPDRIALPINPNAIEVRQTELTRLLKLAEVVKTASIRLAKKQMMRALPMPQGFYIILPNNKDRGVQFGGLVLGMCDLSPMQLGPVEHGQPNLPPATNVENFHQSNKVFPSEVDAYGNPLPIWYTRREEGYRNPVPFRHKLGKTKAEHILASGCESANKPLYSIFVQRDGTERRCTYLESRVYYCTYYEQLVRQTDSYKQLVAMLESGKSLCIVGYDAPNCDLVTAAGLLEWYQDDSAPFGHELVLATMLHLRVNPSLYPWRRDPEYRNLV